MEYLIAAHTDVGIRKKTNQDSLLIKMADTDYGKVVFAAICDGMGGLSKGELASATLVNSLSEWFEEDFPELLYGGMNSHMIRSSMERVISHNATDIARYAFNNNVKMGTTIVAMLLTSQKYHIINVGDSRAYELTDHVVQLTKDQTVVQREIDMGRLTPEEAKRDPRRNMLLQCVGASDFLEPEYLEGDIKKNASYLLCSDGFRHVLTEDEIYQYLCPSNLLDENKMTSNLIYLTDLNKYRREDDNISALVIRTY